MAAGLVLALGKPKSESSEESPARAYAKEAFAALKDDDEEGFVQALMSLTKSKGEEEPDEDDEM